jgi:hypothetical protein
MAFKEALDLPTGWDDAFWIGLDWVCKMREK